MRRTNGDPEKPTAGLVRRTLVLALGLNMAGCAIHQPTPTQIVVPESCMAQQSEIERLRQLLAEKEVLIRSQQANQQQQAKELQVTTREASRAQVKLRRMATQTDAASALAEAEVAMEALMSVTTSAPPGDIRTQAQALLDSANAAYVKADFATSVDRARQALEIIRMVQSRFAGSAIGKRAVTITFQSPVALRTRSECNLRASPSGNAKLVTALKKDTPLTAYAYRGDWLRIQTEDGNSGWLLNTLVEARTDAP